MEYGWSSNVPLNSRISRQRNDQTRKANEHALPLSPREAGSRTSVPSIWSPIPADNNSGKLPELLKRIRGTP
ncbi:hypothetical protein KC349_g223 [Hortaea werneckii]|nr:hypothetical protein KC349_g223 [Hortaea werneckii]